MSPFSWLLPPRSLRPVQSALLTGLGAAAMVVGPTPALTQGIEGRKPNQACPQAPASGLSLQADGRLSLNGAWLFRPDARAETPLTPAPGSFQTLMQQLKRPSAATSSQPETSGQPAPSGQPVPSGQPATAPWQSIQVPANWFLEGQDIHGVAWYCRRFTLPQGVAADLETSASLLKLQFEGVDYAADVWLNGQYLGFHEGYFQPFGFDLARLINPTGPNELLVRVNSPREAEGADWSLRKRLIKGVLSHHDTRPGGAWTDRGQEQNTGGIWAPVSLQMADTVMVDQLKVTPSLKPDGSAEAVVELEVSNGSDRTQVVNLTAQLLPENFTLAPGELALPEQITRHRIPPGGAKIHLKMAHPNPQLWWTWDQGKPHLYRLDVQVRRFDGQAAGGTESNQLLDQASEVFGFRTIERRSDDMAWYLNGRKIFIRGTNYIGSQWLSEMTPARFQQDMDLIRRANVNAVRVHAHVTGREFYHQGDRQGVLIWQDFPLQWGYEDTPEFLAQAKRQAEDMQELLHNHPSVMAWSLHNEPPWDADWMKYKYESYDPQQNKQLDQDLYNHLLGRDPSRWLHLASLTSEHPWWGWYSLEPEAYDKLTKEPLITEFGAQALPSLTTLRSFFTPEQLWPDSEADWAAWDFRNFQQKETFEIAKVEQGNNIQEFIANSQTYQAELTQRAAEAYRRQRFEPVSAIFQFMFVENWASINWGVVDYERNPKPGYDALRRAYQPVLISAIAAETDGQSVGQTRWTAGDEVLLDLWGINDLYQDFPEAQLRLTVKQRQSTKRRQPTRQKIRSLHAFGQTLDLTANGGGVVGQFRDRLYAPGDYLLAMELRDAQGKLLSQNQFEFEVVP